jgi:hypothetical protein
VSGVTRGKGGGAYLKFSDDDASSSFNFFYGCHLGGEYIDESILEPITTELCSLASFNKRPQDLCYIKKY